MKLFVRSLPYQLSHEDFGKFFKAFGPLAEVSLPLDRTTGTSRGFGFVRFENEADARKVLEQGELEIGGRRVYAEAARDTASAPWSAQSDNNAPGSHLFNARSSGVTPRWGSTFSRREYGNGFDNTSRDGEEMTDDSPK